MSKKSNTTQSQNFNTTNSYGWQSVPDTADIQALRNFQFQADPSIGYVYGNARNQLANSFNDPIGGHYSPQMRDAMLRSGQAELSQREGLARSQAYNELQGARFGQRATLAGLTAPRLTQTGSSGSSTGQGTQSQSMLPDLLVAMTMGASQGAAA